MTKNLTHEIRTETHGVRSDLISREEVLRAIITAGECEPDLGYTHLHTVIESFPSADAVEVVRCKDCKHRDLFSCPLADNDFQKDEDFCSWGERREP